MQYKVQTPQECLEAVGNDWRREKLEEHRYGARSSENPSR